MSTITKEQIYDEQISPLMGKIIAICQAHKISMISTYDIPDESDEGLCCTTVTADESGKPSPRIQACSRAAQSGGATLAPMHITTTNSDGAKTLTVVIP